jgi:hypothetical protein
VPLNGGAVYLSGPSDGAGFVGYTMHATFDNCSFNGNAAAGEGGVGDGVPPWFLVIPNNYFSVIWTP